MPWKELKIMDQREQFVLDYLISSANWSKV